jgi:hypothetical protein
VVKVEENGKEDGEWDCNEYISYLDIPEMDKPSSVCSGEERFTCRQRAQIDLSHFPDVNKSCEEYHGERGAIVFDENSDIVLK